MIRRITITVELIALSALVLTTRCANFEDVFVAGNVYFADADCYARMTRVRICAQHPGTIVRHHEFENFPNGTTPHTTAPLDYLVVALATTLTPLTSQPIDMAGAFVSPLLALLCGWFLLWWSRGNLRYRWAALLFFALSPILVHGTELGRPDHQSLLIMLTTIAICAECSLRIAPSRAWSLTSGIAWGMALWVSFYEPLVLLLLVAAFYAVCDRQQFVHRSARTRWIALAGVIGFAFLIERRLPRFPIFANDPILQNWEHTIGELMPLSPLNPIWFRWFGWMLVATPLLFWLAARKRFVGATGSEPDWRCRALPLIATMFVACCLLTLWQTRWAYFFGIIFTLALPMLLEPLKFHALVWSAFAISLFPVLQDWDARIWPNESEIIRRAQARREAIEWRALAERMRSPKVEPFLAPWWLSPSAAYWSGQPGVAGSSHESLPGIIESAQFCLTSNGVAACTLLERRKARWLLVYDAERALGNSSAILNTPIPAQALARVLDRLPSRAPGCLRLVEENGAGKLYRVNYFP